MKLLLILALAVVNAQSPRGFKRRARHHKLAARTPKIYTGLAFWGRQKGHAGACGQTYSDEVLLAGLATPTYKNGKHCNQYIEILNGANNATVVAKVTDSCDGGCAQAGDIYLSPGAFEKIADLNTGVIHVAWTFVQAPRGTHTHTQNQLQPTSQADFIDKARTTSTESCESSSEIIIAASPKPRVEKQQEPAPQPEIKKQEQAPAPKKDPQPVAFEPNQAVSTHDRPAKKVESKPAANPSTSSEPDSGSGGLRLGLAWATDNNWASLLADGLDKWYMHWADGIVPQLSGWDYYPMLWNGSPANVAAFKANMQAAGSPKYILGHNEPDIPSQANTSPQQAAAEWKQYIEPYAGSGAKLVSPAVAWDLNWMKSFMAACGSCSIDAIGMHSYDKYTADAHNFKDRVAAMHEAFPQYKILILEYGLQAESGPSVPQAIQYLHDTVSWMKSVKYVSHAAWFGSFSPDTNPDGYASNSGAIFNNGGSSLSQFGAAYKNL